MIKTENFSDTRIFRSAGLLMRNSFIKVKNMDVDVKKTCGHSFMNHLKSCVEFMKLSYEVNKNDYESKLLYAYIAKDCFSMAEIDLQLIVQSELFPGKAKYNKNVSQKEFKMGTPELYKNSGDIIIQIKGWINSLETELDKENIDNIKKKAQDIICCRHLV